MPTRIYRTTLLALYQLSLLTGVLLLPVAIVARRAGVPVPFDRIIVRLGTALEATK